MSDGRDRGVEPGLHEAARAWGIEPTYTAQDGRRRESSEEALKAALAALGAPVGPSGDGQEALRERAAARRRMPVEPVVVSWEGEAPAVELLLLDSERDAEVRLALTSEEGNPGEWRVAAADLERSGPAPGAHGEGGAFRARVPLDGGDEEGLRRGVHHLRVQVGERTGHARVFRAPRRAWRQELPPGSRGAWGVFAPLYAFRPSGGRPAADLGDLDDLLREAGRLGASRVGTLPLFATFLDEPYEPSPYAPVSRLFWSELWLRPEAAPELARSPKAREALESEELRRETRRLAAADEVDYRGLARVRERVLAPLARTVAAEGGLDHPGIREFTDRCPEAASYARFRAARDLRNGGVGNDTPPNGAPGGPADRGEADEEGRGPGTPFHERMLYHLYVQWLADRQLRAATSGGDGARLYLDLPVGSHPSGYDVSSRPGLFADASTGAPPDDFFEGGQDWGFPPPLPDVMRRTGHAYFRTCLQAVLPFAGTLRLDHVMGLHRLYWVPGGMGPTEGVYVRYPAEELYALLCIESHRHRAEIVGEDLGTVAPEVREAMDRHGLRRMYVLPFELGEREPNPVPPGVAASLDTHDMVPFAGWWRGEDLRERASRGTVEATELEADRERRARGRSVVAALGEAPVRDPGADAPDAEVRSALRSALRWMAASAAGLVLVNLEDLWLETEPQNVPGTPGDRNWKRRMPHDVAGALEQPPVREALREIDRIRRGSEGAPVATAEAGAGEDAPHRPL